MSAAYTTTAGGLVVRWHVPALDECEEPSCTRRHATKAELADIADDDRARGLAEGIEHRP